MAKKGKKAKKKAAKKAAKKSRGSQKKKGDEGGPFPWASLNRFLGFSK